MVMVRIRVRFRVSRSCDAERSYNGGQYCVRFPSALQQVCLYRPGANPASMHLTGRPPFQPNPQTESSWFLRRTPVINVIRDLLTSSASAAETKRAPFLGRVSQLIRRRQVPARPHVLTTRICTNDSPPNRRKSYIDTWGGSDVFGTVAVCMFVRQLKCILGVWRHIRQPAFVHRNAPQFKCTNCEEPWRFCWIFALSHFVLPRYGEMKFVFN